MADFEDIFPKPKPRVLTDEELDNLPELPLSMLENIVDDNSYHGRLRGSLRRSLVKLDAYVVRTGDENVVASLYLRHQREAETLETVANYAQLQRQEIKRIFALYGLAQRPSGTMKRIIKPQFTEEALRQKTVVSPEVIRTAVERMRKDIVYERFDRNGNSLGIPLRSLCAYLSETYDYGIPEGLVSRILTVMGIRNEKGYVVRESKTIQHAA